MAAATGWAQELSILNIYECSLNSFSVMTKDKIKC